MLALHLRAADLADTSLTVSPLFETVLSLRAWTSPERHHLHEPWRRRVRPAWQGCDIEMLTALVSPDGRIPDFLAPRPPTESLAFADEIAVVGATPAAEMRRDVAAAFSTEIPAVLIGPARTVRTRVVQALSRYWATCLEPDWGRIRAVLDGDVDYRAQQLSHFGARKMFEHLDSRVRWDDGVLWVDRLEDQVWVDVDGRGLPLIPSVFVHGAITQTSPNRDPSLVYPARGRGAVWNSAHTTPSLALRNLLGPQRATILTVLDVPSTTVELATALGVSPSAASQHLRVLREGAVVRRVRQGRSVLYVRTSLGDELVGLQR
ncbi:ArsR/SmtB family transcription factor [Rhodococcus sp. AW25M09]|uniref:ArsR/SmtB family transcription factor n=1 Tax=Rhodococcus sp. AW25M09 TaxID=1268303 RepID=UPI0005B54555|nr:helix-turn-helix domain-containing protein [Rhodococcus sp. AW25M09]